jgi:hypothetical protein
VVHIDFGQVQALHYQVIVSNLYLYAN